MSEAPSLAGRRPQASLIQALNDRSATGRPKDVKLWAEDEIVVRQQLEYLDLSESAYPEPARSTIAVAFSTDGKLFASTHGDHTVKITSFLRGRVVQTLRGHPRTPWTVKFHPKDSKIVASGCIGHEVRVWNASTGQCLHVATLEAAIISLSFHPSGRMLAMASSLYVYLWDYNNNARPFIAWAHSHTLRCVRFTPGGNGIIVGAANSSSVAPASQRNHNAGGAATGGGGATAAAAAAPSPAQAAVVTFRLQVWDFSLEAALEEHIASAMTRERVILSRTLLYNDGGFDVSQDGLWLCAIAELRDNDNGVSDGHPPPPPPPPPPLPPNPNSGSGAVSVSLSSASVPGTATVPAAMPTLMEVDDLGDEEEGKGEQKDEERGGDNVGMDVATGEGVTRNQSEGRLSEKSGRDSMSGAGGTVGGGLPSSGSRSGVSSGVVAPKNGSQLGGRHRQTTPVVGVISTDATTEEAPAALAAAVADSVAEVRIGQPQMTTTTAAAAAAAARTVGERGLGGVGDEVEGGRREEGGGGDKVGGRPVLPPWPSRARPRPYFSAALAAAAAAAAAEGEQGGEHRAKSEPGTGAGDGRGASDASSVDRAAAAAAAAATIGTTGNGPPPPFTPPPFTPSPRITLKRRLSGGWLSAGGGGSGGSSGGGFWGRERRRGGSPRSGNTGARGQEVAGGRTMLRQEGYRPPRLPPPPPPPPVSDENVLSSGGSFSRASPVFPSSSLAASLPEAAPARPPLPPPLPPATTTVVASSSSLSGGLRISLPLLLPPPPPPPRPSPRLGLNAVGTDTVEEDRQGADTQQRQRLSEPEPPPSLPPPTSLQPVFFLQVPGRSSAAAAAAVAAAAAAATSVREGGTRGAAGGWSPQYLSGGGAAVVGGTPPVAAPVTFGRNRGAVRERAGGSGGAEQANLARSGGGTNPSDGAGGDTGSGGGGRWAGGPHDGSNTLWDSLGNTVGGGTSTSFGRGRRRAPPPLSSSPSSPATGAASHRFVPHLVLVSLSGGGGCESAARVVRAEQMDRLSAKQVTSVKLSPSARYILLGVGVRGDGGAGHAPVQQVAAPNRQGEAAAAFAAVGTAAAAAASTPATPLSQRPRALSSIYRCSDLQPMCSMPMPTAEEDVNIACFHPEPGMGCAYGTKQGRVGLVRMANA